MKKIKVVNSENDLLLHDFNKDCIRIQKVLADRELEATLEQSRDLWALYSECSDAGWCGLPVLDQDIYMCVSGFIEVVDEI